MANLVYGESRISDIIKDVNGKSALNEENTFTQKNTFEVLPECSVDATEDNQLVNLKTLKDKIQESGIDTSGLAKLKALNTFTDDNYFSKRVFLKNAEKAPNLGSVAILSDINNNGFISFMKNLKNTYTNVLARVGILDGGSNNTFDFKGDNDLTAFRFNKNVILENATEDNHALNRATADTRFIRRDIEDTLDNQLNFNVLPKSNIDATEDSHLVNLKTLKSNIVEADLSNVPKLDTDNIFTGNNTFNNPVIVGNATEDNHALNRGEADKRYGLKLLTSNLEWTVSNEPENETNFNTLSKALKEAVKYSPISTETIKITIKSGFIINETFQFYDIDLSFVVIESEDSEVNVSSTGIFFGSNRAKLPILNCILNFSNYCTMQLNRSIFRVYNKGGFSNFGHFLFNICEIAFDTDSTIKGKLDTTEALFMNFMQCSRSYVYSNIELNETSSSRDRGLGVYHFQNCSSSIFSPKKLNVSFKNNNQPKYVIMNNNSNLDIPLNTCDISLENINSFRFIELYSNSNTSFNANSINISGGVSGGVVFSIVNSAKITTNDLSLKSRIKYTNLALTNITPSVLTSEGGFTNIR